MLLTHHVFCTHTMTEMVKVIQLQKIDIQALENTLHFGNITVIMAVSMLYAMFMELGCMTKCQ